MLGIIIMRRIMLQNAYATTNSTIKMDYLLQCIRLIRCIYLKPANFSLFCWQTFANLEQKVKRKKERFFLPGI